MLFDSHPPNGVRVAALRWESNFVGSIPKNAHSENAAFRAMKNRLKYLDEIDEERLRQAREKQRRAGHDSKAIAQLYRAEIVCKRLNLQAMG